MSFSSSETVSSSVAARGGLPGGFWNDSLQTYTQITIPKNSVLYDGSLVSRAAARWNCQPNCGPNSKKDGAFPETQSCSSSSAAKDWLEEENARVLQMWNIRSLDDEEDSPDKCPSFADVFTTSSAASRALASLEASKESQFHYWEQRSRQLDQALSSSTSKKEKWDPEAPSVEIEIPVEVFGEDYALARQILDQINRSCDDFSYITKDNVMLIMRIADYFLNDRLLDACDGVLAGMIKKLDADAPEDVIETFYKLVYPPHFQKPILEKARGSLAKCFSCKLIKVANESRINGISSCDGLNAYIKSLEARGVRILELNFSSIPFVDEDHLIWILEAVPGLTKLDLSAKLGTIRAEITDRIGKSLEGLANLTTFRFIGSENLTDEIGKSLAILSNLETVILVTFKNMTCEIIKHLEKLSNLKRLSLIGVENLTDEIGKSLAMFSNLEVLVLSSGEQLTDKIGKDLKTLSNLKMLVLAGCLNLTDRIGESLKGLRNLEFLHLNGCPNLTDEIVESLEMLPKLTGLCLGNAQLTDKIGKRLEKLPKLRSLSLSGCKQFTDEVVESLKLLSGLKHLDLSYCKGLKGETLKSLKQFPELEGLDLSHCVGLKKEIVKDLADLPQLEFLSLYGCSDELRKEIGIGLNSFQNLKLLVLDESPEQLQAPSEKPVIVKCVPYLWSLFDPVRECLERHRPDRIYI